MKRKAIVWSLFLLLLLGGGTAAMIFYQRLYGPAIHTLNGQKAYLYVPTRSTFQALKENLIKAQFIQDTAGFEYAAQYFKLNRTIKPGKYEMTDGMSLKRLIRKLALGDQVPVYLVLHNLRLKENLAGYVSHRLEVDSMAIMTLMNSPQVADSIGFTADNLYCIFIPDTYLVQWNESAPQFLHRMHQEYLHFWNAERKAKAEHLGLTPIQVLILASIVTQESNKPGDMSLIAGVYLNRLKIGMKLEADPTVVYANQDFTIRRVTQKYLVKESPYNTYRVRGLPPGPITMPSRQSIDAVLMSQPTTYLYFCAKDDFSGNHAFATTPAEHRINARKFHEALNARNIH